MGRNLDMCVFLQKAAGVYESELMRSGGSAHSGGVPDWIVITLYLSIIMVVALFVVFEYERGKRRRTPRR